MRQLTNGTANQNRKGISKLPMRQLTLIILRIQPEKRF